MTETKHIPVHLNFAIRVMITAGITIGCYLSLLYGHYITDGGETQFSIWPNSIVVLLCLPLGYVIWKNLKADADSLKIYQTTGGILLGAVGLIMGIAIPILLEMGEQGPLIGIILIGPIGFILGMVFGGLYWKRKMKAANKD